jgi:hypothetical protein
MVTTYRQSLSKVLVETVKPQIPIFLITDLFCWNACLTSKAKNLLGSGKNMHPGHGQRLRKRAAWTNSLRTGMKRLAIPESVPATPDTTDLPATNVHFASTSRDTLSWAQNSFSTETNKPGSKLTITHMMAKPTQNSPSTTEAKQEEGYHLCTTCGSAEMKIPNQKIYEKRHRFFGNKGGREELEFITTSDEVTADTGFISNYSLTADEDVVTTEVLSNTSTEEIRYTEGVPTQNTSTDMEADEPANNCSLNGSSPFGPGAKNDSVEDEGEGEGNDTLADYDRTVSPILNTTTITTNTTTATTTAPTTTTMTTTTTTTRTTRTRTTTTTTTAPTGCSDSCNAQDHYGLNWTGCPGSYVSRPCPNRALGEAKWFCDLHGTNFVGDMPDYTNCTHVWIGEVQEKVSRSCGFGTFIGRDPPSRFVQQ